MNSIPTTLPAADELLSGVLDLAVARPLALRAFVSVSAVEWNDDVATACVECAYRPRLLLNPGFVAERCGTRERLAMLLLHELSHISLGHTRLYPLLTPAHNVAFDAIINAAVLNGLHGVNIDPAPYAALLVDCYDAESAPLFILRPPPGWPHEPDWSASKGAGGALHRVHRLLYARSRRRREGITYGAILHALGEHGGCDAALVGQLLGAHGTREAEVNALNGVRDAAAAEMLRASVDALAGVSGAGWGTGKERSTTTIASRQAGRALQRALARLLRRVFVEQSASTRRFIEHAQPILSVDPSHDRRAAGRTLLARHFGTPAPLLFASRVIERTPERVAATIYIDVSGSMTGLLEPLHGALVPLRRLLAPEVFAFSNSVEPIPLRDFVRGDVCTTWGTEVGPVLEHMAARAGSAARKQSRALLLTDGYFDRPASRTVDVLRASRAELHVAVIGDGPLPQGAWVASATRLPKTVTREPEDVLT